MFRRARFSVKPNVRPAAAGRSGSARSGSSSVIEEAAAPGSEAQPGSGPTACSSAAGVDAAPQSGAAARGFQQEQGASSSRDEKTSDASGDGDGSKCSETVLQRRKRISTMPNLAKPRVAPPSKQRAVSLVSKCPQKSVPHPPACGTTVLQKESISPEKINIENSSKSPILPEKKTPVPQVPQFSPFKKSVSKEPNAGVMAQKIDDTLQKNTFSPLKERPTQDKLIQEEMPPSKSALAKEKRISSDREKILKARKLRKLLKEELKKEKQQRKNKCPIIEKSMPEDRSKMLMRDFIYYLPENNPMKSSLVEEKKIEKTSTVTQPKEPEQKAVADHEDENEEAEEEEGEDEDSPLLVPRVKVAEDGSIILDEESLTVEVLRTKGQCVVEENDPIFERGSTTTYSSFRKSYYTKPWSEKETDMFFLAISMVGTDFSMISQLFPHRARTEIKNKFKREEKINGWRIDKAFKEKKPFDFGFFAKLLEKVLENERRKKKKDAKCQSPKEKISKEEKTQKYQKKQKAKDVSGQPNHVQDDQQNGIISDAEMEVDSGTAEKENEESLSMLEQAEGQTAVESGVAKKKRKRRKKDSEQEADNLSEERTISAEMSEGERFKKKRKNASSSGIVSEDLEILDGETPDPVEEEPQCFIQLNEGAEGDASLASSSIQHNALLEAESGELDISEANFEHHVGQPSKSSPRATKVGFEETVAAKNEVAELDELDENCSTPAPSLDETMETEGATTEKPKVEGQLQKLKSDLTRVSEKREPQVNDTSEVKTALSESLGGTEKGRAKDKVTKVTGPTIEEVTEGTNSDMKRGSQETQKAVSEKVEVRGRRQKPKPNIAKVPSRKEAPVQGKLECRIPCQGPVGKVEKSNDLNDALNATTVEAAEKDCQSFDTETQACEKSLLQESSKPTILKAAPLARGRMQRPKPNLGRVARRQDSTRNTEAEGEKLTAVAETKKMQMDPECSHDELLIKDTAAIFPSNMVPTVLEATTYEDDMPHSEILENKDVSSSKKVSSAHTSHPSAQEPLDCENCELKKTSFSSVSVEDVSDLAAEDSSLQEEQKEMAPEIQHSLKSYPLNQKEDLGKVAETKTFENKHETEKGSIKLTSEYSKDSNLNEAAKCEILPSSHSSEQHSAGAHDAIATLKTHQSPQKFSDLDSDGPNKISLSSDIKKETSIGKQSSQGKSNQDAIQPPQLLRGRFQRPKPNIGRAIGRKETQYVEKNEATLAIAGTEKSEVQIFARTSSTIPPLPCNNKVLPVEALENRLVDCEKSIQEDSRVISDQRARKKSTFQEDTSCTIKPARLVRGRFQRARPNLGRMSDKKEEPVSENASASVDSGLGKTETEVMSKGDLNIPSVDEGSVHTSLDYLEKKDKLESSVATSPETYSEQKKPPSFKMLQECELLKGQEETCTSKDIEGKYLDIPGSDISAPQEINQTRSINPTQLMRDLQKPKPNLSRAAKKKETFSEGEISTKDKIEKDTESDDSLCGSKSGKISVLGHEFGKVVEASCSEASKEKKCTEITEAVSSKRSRPSGKCESLQQLSENESQIGKDISKPVSAQERASEILKRKQPERSLKQRKNTCESKTTSSTSECETDHGEKGRHLRKVKPNVSRGKSLKPALGRKSRKEFGSSKVNLVTLRASSQEEEEEDDDADDFEPDYEPECFLPEEVNKAPVFVPKGLRSPNPVPVQIEETMEELEIYENVTEELCIATAENLCPELNVATEPVIQGDKELPSSLVVISQKESEKKTGANDGSTEAAMTLLAMRDPVFQLNTTQEKTQEFPNQEELNITDNFSKEPNEEQSIIHSDLPLSVVSKHELVSSSNTNKAEPKDPSTSALEECSQEATRACSDLSASKENKVSKLRRCRFPKPNLSKSLRLNRNAPQKSLNPSSDVAQSNEIWDDKFSVLTLKECLTQREGKASKNVTEEQKVELEQNLQLDKLANSSMDEHDLQHGSSCQAIQENNAEREDLLRETWESRSELTPKPSPKAESSPPELPSEPNTDINVQFPEKVSGPAEYQLSAVDIAQTEANKHLGISAATEITAESRSIVEHPEAEEEQTFILTLVEISAASEDCSDESTSLQQASEELLLAPVLFTPDNAETAELTRKNSIRSTTVTAEENAAFMDNATETEELQVASAEHFAQPQPSSSSWENQERDAVALERSASLPEKKKTSSFAGESLKSSNKETSLKLRCIPRKAAEKSSEKLSMSKKRNSSTSNLICETSKLQVNKPQSCLNLEAVLLDEAASSDEQVSRTVHAGKAETSEEQRSFVSIWKSEELKQVGSAAVLPKMPLSRPSQKSLGFLPLICKKNNTDEEETTKRNKQSLQKPLTLEPTSTALSSRDKKEETHRNSSLSTTYSSSTKCENVSSSTIQFHSDLPKNEGSPKEQEKDEEPTKISEYFFSDIFMEVDDSE